MDYRSGNIGRVFWVRFEDGENLLTGLKDLAQRETIDQGLVLVLGALKQGNVVLGPKETAIPPDPMWIQFTGAHEILGVGTIAGSPEGPSVHLHAGAGRGGEPPLVGCVRGENEVYLVAEVLVLEVTGFSAERRPDPASGMNLLTFD